MAIPTTGRANDTALLDAAAELNAVLHVDDALPLFARLALELTGADTASVVAWDASLRNGVVRAAAGVAAERAGASLRGSAGLPARAVRAGAVQTGPLGPSGFAAELERAMEPLRVGVSLPLRTPDGSLTVQVAWLEEQGDDMLEAAAETLTRLASLTRLDLRSSGERVRSDERARLDAVSAAVVDGLLVERHDRWIANPAAQRLLALPDEALPALERLSVRDLDGRPISPGAELPERFRVRVTSLDGRELVLDGSYSASPVRVIVFRDVTDEHRREHMNAEFLRALRDTIPTPISVVEAGSRRVLSVNRAFEQLTGWTEAEVLGAERPYPWWAEGERPNDPGPGVRYPRVYRHRDGRSIPVELELHDMHDDDGNVTAHLAVVRDLSQQRRFEQQLAQSGKLAAIGELASGVAHEINNPLFAILGLVEFLLAEAEEGTKRRERLELVHQTALEIKQIVRALLDFARESSGERRVVALDGVIRETVELVRRTSSNHGVETREEFGAGPFPVHGNANQLKQIFLNLLANARQALPDGGTVTIGLEERDGFLTATVHDTGDGIPAELLPRIFEPFFTTKRETGGTGLGLPVSLGIAEAHGGSLTAASEPGSGAVFAVRLPRHEGGGR